MFWKRKAEAGETGKVEQKKLPGPKTIPELIGRYLVTELAQNPDWVWNLKSVLSPRNLKDSFDFRIFDINQTSQAKLSVKNYTSLDTHPGLVLYQGWFDMKSCEVHMEQKAAP